MKNLMSDAELIRHSNAVVAGTTDIEPAAGVDTADCEGVLFIVSLGAITAGAVTSVKAQQSSAADGAGDAFADLEGSEIAVADDDDNQLVYVDVRRPTERFVRCVVARGTENAVVDGITAIKYGLRKRPATQGATVVGGKIVAGPDEA